MTTIKNAALKKKKRIQLSNNTVDGKTFYKEQIKYNALHLSAINHRKILITLCLYDGTMFRT